MVADSESKVGVVFRNHEQSIAVISTEALFGFFVVNHWIIEAADMAGCLPDLWVLDDGGVYGDDGDGFAVGAEFAVAALHDDIGPPGVAEVFFELGAEWAVVPEAVDSAVDFGCLVDESSAFAEGHDVVHGFDGGGGFGG